MRVGTLVLSSWVLIASASWGCKVEVGDPDDNDRGSEEDTDTRDGGTARAGKPGTAGKPAKPTGGMGGGGTGARTDGGVNDAASGQAGRAGSGSGNAGSGPSTPVPSGTMLSDLDADDAEALCDQFAQELAGIISEEDVERFNCTIEGFIEAYMIDPETSVIVVDVDACKAEAAQCLETGLGESTGECDTQGLLAGAQNCDATVEEYLDCQRGSAEQLADAFDKITCDTLGDPMVAEEALFIGDSSEIPACVTLANKCPGLVDDGES